MRHSRTNEELVRLRDGTVRQFHEHAAARLLRKSVRQGKLHLHHDGRVLLRRHYLRIAAAGPRRISVAHVPDRLRVGNHPSVRLGHSVDGTHFAARSAQRPLPDDLRHRRGVMHSRDFTVSRRNTTTGSVLLASHLRRIEYRGTLRYADGSDDQ